MARKIGQYDELTGPQPVFTPFLKRATLENIVSIIGGIRAVKAQAEQSNCQHNKQITYEDYCMVLLSATQSYGLIISNKSNFRNTRRSIYQHTLHAEDYESGIDPQYNIYIPIHELNINPTQLYSTPSNDEKYVHLETHLPVLAAHFTQTTPQQPRLSH